MHTFTHTRMRHAKFAPYLYTHIPMYVYYTHGFHLRRSGTRLLLPCLEIETPRLYAKFAPYLYTHIPMYAYSTDSHTHFMEKPAKNPKGVVYVHTAHYGSQIPCQKALPSLLYLYLYAQHLQVCIGNREIFTRVCITQHKTLSKSLTISMPRVSANSLFSTCPKGGCIKPTSTRAQTICDAE
jgi:hypothetical protein